MNTSMPMYNPPVKTNTQFDRLPTDKSVGCLIV